MTIMAMRNCAKSGIFENFSSFRDMESMHFSEWWNGQGLDITFYSNDPYDHDTTNQKIALHFDQLQVLVTAALACDMIDINAAIGDSINLKDKGK